MVSVLHALCSQHLLSTLYQRSCIRWWLMTPYRRQTIIWTNAGIILMWSTRKIGRFLKSVFPHAISVPGIKHDYSYKIFLHISSYHVKLIAPTGDASTTSVSNQKVYCLLWCTISLSSLCKLIWRHWTYKMPVRYILSSVWVRLSIFSP